MTVIYHLLVASLSVAVMAALWTAVQALVRRNSPQLGEDEDVLACRTCAASGACAGCAHSPAAATSGGAHSSGADRRAADTAEDFRKKRRAESDAEEVGTLSL